MLGALLLPLLVSSLSSTQQFLGQRDEGWPSVTTGANTMAGSGNPDETDAAAARVVSPRLGGPVAGVYLLVYKPQKLLLDTFAAPEGAIGLNGEAVLRKPEATLTQEWWIRPFTPPGSSEVEYSIANRATGNRIQPPPVGVSVVSGPARGGWTIEGSEAEGYTIHSKATGDVLVPNKGAVPMLATTEPAPKRKIPGWWDLQLVHSQPPTSDDELGYMPVLPLDAEHIDEGVYTITDSITGDKFCAHTTRDGGVGDYEAFLDPACPLEWGIRFSAPNPNNTDAVAAPPAIYEVRELASGIVLDAYMFGTFGAHLRGDEKKISQRWFFEPAKGGGHKIVQASIDRFLSVTHFGIGTTGKEHSELDHIWTLQFLRGLPPLPGQCKTACDANFTCGEIDDGCGGVLTCGACDALSTCSGNVCICTPFACEENMCGMVADGCGAQMDCGGCSGGLFCDANTSSCVEGPPLPAIPNISNATLDAPEPPPAAVNETVPACNCPACECACPACNATKPNASNATPLTVPPAVVNVTPNATGPDYIGMLAPGLLERLRGIFAEAAVDSLGGYPVNMTQVRKAASDSLTETSVIAAAEQVTLPEPTERVLRARAFEQAQGEYNSSLAENVVTMDVIPAYLRNLTARENFTQVLADEADPLAFQASVAVAGENASRVAAQSAVDYVDGYKSLVATKAYTSVRDATIRIASDVAVNSLTYNLEESIMDGVKFDPTDVMRRAHTSLKAQNAAQAVAEEVSGLLAMRAKQGKLNATNATGA